MEKKINIIILIIAILLVYNIFVDNKIKTDIESYESKIEALQHKIDSVNLLNKRIDTKIDYIYSQIEVIDEDILKVQSNIKDIKNSTNEQVDSINNYNFSELEQFFTERYSKRLNNTSEDSNR